MDEKKSSKYIMERTFITRVMTEGLNGLVRTSVKGEKELR
jgi:hypothetical protein